MSQPPTYNRSASFTNLQAVNPSGQPPGSSLDIEFNNVKTTLDAVLANLALIQRDDTALANESVGLDQLSDEVTIGFSTPTAWVTAHAYVSSPASTVFQGGKFYSCLVSHTSGVFATDLAAVKWVLIADLTSIPITTAAQVSVVASGLLTTDVQGSLQALDSGKAATSHTHPASAISDSTAAGRNFLKAADLAAQKTILGLGALAFLNTVAVTDISAQLTLSGVISPAALSASTNDWAPTGIGTTETIRVSASNDINLTGITAQAEGTILDLENVGSKFITLTVNDTASAAANRFSMAAPLVLGPNQSTTLRYDNTTARWRLRNSVSTFRNPRGWIDGLTLSQGSTTSLAIAAGTCRDVADTVDMTLTAFTKTTSAWAVGTGNGGLDTGAIANSTRYYAYVVEKSSDGTTDALFTATYGSPTMPSGYDKKRYIGSFKTNGSAQVPVILQRGGYFYHPVMVSEYNTSVGDTTAHLLALTVPTGFKVRALLSAAIASNIHVAITDPATTDTAVGSTFFTFFGGSNGGGAPHETWTDTSGQVRYRLETTSTLLSVITTGYFDPRDANA